MTKVVAFDTETRGLNWFDPTQRAFLLSWADECGEYVADLSDPDQVSHALSQLNDADILVCHNATFDLHQMRESLGWHGLDCARVEDTDLISRVMYPAGQRDNGGRGGHGLKTLAETFIDPAAKEAEEKIEEMANSIGVKLKGVNATTGAYYEVWRAYPEPMEHYAKMDARYTWDLYTKFMDGMTSQQEHVYELERRVLPVLYHAERKGVALAQEPVLDLKKQYEQQLHETQDYLSKELGDDALGGPGSEAALLEALQKQGIPLYRRTDTGQLSTAAPALREFEAEFPVVRELFRWRTANKFLATYINPMVDREVVHPNFAQIGAWTGRMSCYRPNMQNIPKQAGKEVRSMFVPRPGYCFVVSDYDSIEARLLAYYLGDAGYRRLLDEGHDPHAWMAAQIHGGEVEAYHKGTPNQPLRDAAKEVTYAICYGAGGPRVTDVLGLDPGPYDEAGKPQYRQARVLIKKVKDSLPGYYHLMNRRIKPKIEELGYVNTLWGRQQMVNKDKAYVGMNALIQGSAADIMKQGLVNVEEATRHLGAYPILVVHDECVTECPIEHAEECLALQDAAMCEAYSLNPRLKAEGKIVFNNYAEA